MNPRVRTVQYHETERHEDREVVTLRNTSRRHFWLDRWCAGRRRLISSATRDGAVHKLTVGHTRW
jgi:hypothetical protein